MGKSDLSLSFLDISPYVRYIHHQKDATSKNFYIPWRYIYDYELIFILDGVMTVLQENESYELNANDIHIMEPQVRHRRLIPEGSVCNYYSVHFDIAYVSDNLNFSPDEIYVANCNNPKVSDVPIDLTLTKRMIFSIGDIRLPKKMHIQHSAEIIQLLENLTNCFLKKEFAYEIDMKCGMLQILKIILIRIRSEIVSDDTHNEDHISAIIQYVYTHYQEDVYFQAISLIYGYSYSNMRKLFKERTGKSPNRFLTDVRMKKANELLQSRKYSITEVAGMVGYQDSGYFSRVFKQHTGKSPSDVAKL